MKILAVRHGEFNFTLKKGELIDSGLTHEGKKRVKELARTLKNLDITIIYSSPVRRAHETAEILSQELGIGAGYFPLLKDVEPPTGKNLTEWINKIQRGGAAWQKLWVEGWPGIESPKDYQERTLKAIQKILKTHPKEENILIVGHEETIWTMLWWKKRIPFSQAVTTKIGYCSLREFSFSKEDIG